MCGQVLKNFSNATNSVPNDKKYKSYNTIIFPQYISPVRQSASPPVPKTIYLVNEHSLNSLNEWKNQFYVDYVNSAPLHSISNK